MARTLGVICARDGSKGFPGKNLAEAGGVPMIVRSCMQADRSKLLTRWVVSTDSKDIADLTYGGRVLWRPPALAQDDSRIEGALQHALKYCEEEEGEEYDYVCMLLNTHPLRTSEDIDGCIGLMDGYTDSVVSGYWIEHPYEIRLPQKMSDNHYVAWDTTRLYRKSYQRQDSPPVFLGNGAVVGMTRECLTEQDSIWGDKSLLYSMPMYRSQDVDSPEDLKACEIILRGMESCNVSSAECETSFC